MLEVPGIDLNAKDSNGRTIVEVAKEVGNQGVEKLLVEKCESWQEWKDLDGKKNIQLHHCRVHQMWLKRAQGLKNGKETTLNNFGIIPCEKIKLSTKYWWRKKFYSVMMFNAMYMLWFSFKAFKATLKSYQNIFKNDVILQIAKSKLEAIYFRLLNS